MEKCLHVGTFHVKSLNYDIFCIYHIKLDLLSALYLNCFISLNTSKTLYLECISDDTVTCSRFFKSIYAKVKNKESTYSWNYIFPQFIDNFHAINIHNLYYNTSRLSDILIAEILKHTNFTFFWAFMPNFTILP